MPTFNSNKEKLLYSGYSLENYLKVKNILQTNSIKFTEKSKRHDSWFRFIILMLIGTGSYGMHDERVTDYNIYVGIGDYEYAKRVTEL